MYNFKSFKNRRDLGSAKYNRMLEANPDVDEDIIPLSVADMEFNVAPEIIEGLRDYLIDSVLGYPVLSDKYKDAVIDWFRRRYNWDIDGDWMVETQGVVPALYAAVEAFTEVDDGVILLAPVYGPFFTAISDNERRIIRSPLIYEDGYKIDFEDLERKAKDPKNKLLLFCNPHNPVGRVWTVEELKRVGQICLDNDVIIISDEIHADIIMPGHKFNTFGNISEEISQNIIVSSSPSKTFNIAGLFTSNNIIKNQKLRDAFTSALEKRHLKGANILGLRACELAYTKGEEWLEELLLVLDGNRKYVLDFFDREIPEVIAHDIEGTFLIWLDFRRMKMSDPDLDEFLEKEVQLFLTDGKFFGNEGKGFKRINIGCPKYVLEEALTRLKAAIDKRRKDDE